MVASDPDSSYTLEYDLLDGLLRIDNQDTPTVPHVMLGSPYNQLLEDGTHRYKYEAEGNRTVKENITTPEREEYA